MITLIICLVFVLWLVVGGILYYMSPSKEEIRKAREELLAAYLNYASHPDTTDAQRKAAASIIATKLP